LLVTDFEFINNKFLLGIQNNNCYESSKRRKVSQAFKYLIQNLKMYNRVKDINSVGTRVMQQGQMITEHSGRT